MKPTDDGIEVGEPEGRLQQAVRSFLTPRPGKATSRDADLLQQGLAMTLACGTVATTWGDGPIVMLVHGWESRGTHWGAFVSGLVDAGFRAIAVDAPAHGGSPGERTTVLEYARRLVDAEREVGPLFGVVGHSFGAGAIAIALDRGLMADRVVLISGPASLIAVVKRRGRAHGLSEDELPTFVQLIEQEIGEPMEPLDITRLARRFRRPGLIVHDRGDDDVPVEEGLSVGAAWPVQECFSPTLRPSSDFDRQGGCARGHSLPQGRGLLNSGLMMPS